MRRALCSLLVVTLLAGLLACSSRVTGTYRSQTHKEHYMVLKADGRFERWEGEQGYTGTYEVDGDTIVFKLNMGMAFRCKIHGDTITDPDGEDWVKGK